jgi:hypothetical protein
MNLFEEFFLLIPNLNAIGIQYAVIGGIALAFHDKPRFTRDIDILISSEDIDNIRNVLSKLGYVETAEPWTFTNTQLTMYRFLKVVGKDSLMVDILLATSKEHKAIIKRAIETESEQGIVRVARKNDLVWLKQFRNSPQDIADIDGLRNDKD